MTTKDSTGMIARQTAIRLINALANTDFEIDGAQNGLGCMIPRGGLVRDARTKYGWWSTHFTWRVRYYIECITLNVYSGCCMECTCVVCTWSVAWNGHIECCMECDMKCIHSHRVHNHVTGYTFSITMHIHTRVRHSYILLSAQYGTIYNIV